MPVGWGISLESNDLLPITSIPQGLGASVANGGWKAYAVSPWDRLQGSNVPPWEKPWELHQITAGASGQFPWVASLLVSETKISRDDADSLADHLVGLGLASPQQRLALNGAWSSSRQNPGGGFALGAKWMQPINSAQLELTLRQRSKDWVPA